MSANTFPESGWIRFDYDPTLLGWLQHATTAAIDSVANPRNSQWLRHQGTWFVGVNALPNNAFGQIGDSENLDGFAVRWLRRYVHSAFKQSSSSYEKIAWDSAQVSVCYPGYPKRSSDESEAAHLFRVQRDAAHVDGLLKEGPSRARYLREHHAFILGIPVSEYSSSASPFVVWEGSHKIIQRRLQETLASIPPQQWQSTDISQTYVDARQEVFNQCKRTEVYAQVGESFAVHRLAVHSMAPWADGATSDENGRMIAFFRPQIIDATQWLNGQ